MKKIFSLLSLLWIPLYICAQTEVAIFGGSVAQFFQDKGTQAILKENMPGYRFHNFAKAGDGLCKQTQYVDGTVKIGGIPEKVKEACQPGKPHYDIYIIWCSTNDIWGNRIGVSSDYTSDDGYDISRLTTQCGGLNYCIKTITEYSPGAVILLFASMKSFGSSYGYSMTGETRYNPPRRMWDYVKAQKNCAARYSVPVLDLWTESGINELNYKLLCPDGIHPTKEGYLRLCPLFKRFISSHTVQKH